MKHDYVVSCSMDRTAFLSPLCPNDDSSVIKIAKYSGFVSNVTVYQTSFMISGDNFIAMWRMLPHPTEDEVWLPESVFLYVEPNLCFDVFTMWDGKISGLTVCNRFYSLNRNGQNVERVYTTPLQTFHERDAVIIKRYVWRSWVYAWLTGHRLLYISVAHNSARYNPMPVLHSSPYSLLLYGDIFLMGMESGSLYAYTIQSPEDLLTLDLPAYSWSCSVATEAILQLDIADDSSEPIIVASTGKDLYYISLNPNVQSH